MRYSIGAPSIDIPQRLQRRNMKNVCNLLFNFTYAIDNHHVRIRSEASRVFIEQSFEAGAEALGNEDERVLQVQIFVIVVPFFFVVSTNCLFGHVDKSTGENKKKKVSKAVIIFVPCPPYLSPQNFVSPLERLKRRKKFYKQ